MRNAPVKSGASVAFRLKDALCPDFGQIICQLGPDVEVCGEVAYLSDRGQETSYFAIVAVSGIDTPLIVPIAKLQKYQIAKIQPTVRQANCPEPEPSGRNGRATNDPN